VNTLKTCLIGGLLLLANQVSALTPAPVDERQSLVLHNAVVHVGDGQVINPGVVAMSEGTITVVGGNDALAELDLTSYQFVDLGGAHVYPGLILPGSNLGLNEVGSLGDTIDQSETGDLNPNVRSLIAYNTDSELIPVTRYNGVLTAQITPEGGLISGQSSVVQLDAWNWQDAAVVVDDGIHMNWPSSKKREFDFATFSVKLADNKQQAEHIAIVEQLFSDAASWLESDDKMRNLKLDAVVGLFDGSKRLYISANLAQDMVDAVDFARRHKIVHVVLKADAEALKVAEFLAAEQVPVIVTGLHTTPRSDDEDIDLPYRVPAELLNAGVKVGLTYPGVMNARNLPFIAGTASAYGLDREQALRLVTLSNAEILGIDDQLGSLAVGKQATLFVSQGDALDMRGNQLTHAFIGGREIVLDGMQQSLYQRFHKRYATLDESD